MCMHFILPFHFQYILRWYDGSIGNSLYHWCLGLHINAEKITILQVIYLIDFIVSRRVYFTSDVTDICSKWFC